MFVGRPPGNYDRLLDFSTAVTGSLFFAPSATFLDDIGGDEPHSTADVAQTREAPSDLSAQDTSLGIGSLKGEKNE